MKHLLGGNKGRTSILAASIKNYKAVAFSRPNIWGHLDARLEADWPPGLTHSYILILCDAHIIHTLSSSFTAVSSVGEKNKSVHSDPLWLSGLNIGHWIEFLACVQFTPTSLCPLHSTPFSLLFSLTFYTQLSPSPVLPTVPLPLSSSEIQDVTFCFSPPAVLLNSSKYVRGNLTVEARVESGSRKIVLVGIHILHVAPERVNTCSWKPQDFDKLLRSDW